MGIDIENMENKMNSLIYEKPTLKNYGTMKSLTLGASGSGGDAIGSSNAASPGAFQDNATNDGATAGGFNDPSDAPADAHNGAAGFQSDN